MGELLVVSQGGACADCVAGVVRLYGVGLPEIERLLDPDWGQPDEAIHVRDNLGLVEAEQSRFFRNARIVLNALDESGGTKATAAGNLNRKFVGEMMGQLDLAPGSVESIRETNKTINEEDVWSLHMSRVILELAHLIRRTKGQFRVTKKGSSLRVDDQAGVLYSLLFRTCFQEFNLGYLDAMAEVPILQHTVGFSLFVVSWLMDDWQRVSEVAPDLLLPMVLEEIPPSAFGDRTAYLVHSRILKPLADFGLLEERQPGDKWEHREVRKTELFHRVLEFNVELTHVPLDEPD